MFSPSTANFIHTLCELAAYTVGYQYYRRLRAQQGDGISEMDRLAILIGTVIGALVGSRIVGMLEQPEQNFQSTHILASILSNKSIVGGLLGGLIGTEITKKRLGIRLSSGDLITYPIILGLIIGRVGCFFGGLSDGTCGIPSSLPWAFDFGDGIPRHPAQLYEILFLLVLWLGIYALERRYTLSNGSRFKIFLSSYLVFRLCIEYIKPDPTVFMNLSTIQWSCVLGLLYYYRVFVQPQHLIVHEAKT